VWVLASDGNARGRSLALGIVVFTSFDVCFALPWNLFFDKRATRIALHCSKKLRRS
jgi:hypothetical protein